MFIIYCLPFLTYVYFYLTSTFTSSLYHKLIFLAVTLHFAKRCLEVFDFCIVILEKFLF